MWTVTGEPRPTDLFGDLEPIEVLNWHDGPKTFTVARLCNNPDLWLVHWLDEDQQSMRFLVVPTSIGMLEKLRRNEKSLLQSLTHPYVYVVDQANDGRVLALWRVRFRDVPEKYLPEPGVALPDPDVKLRMLMETDYGQENEPNS